LALVSLVGVHAAIGLSVVPGLLAAAAIVYAIRHAPAATARTRQPIRLPVCPVLAGRLGRLMIGLASTAEGSLASCSA
jgi:hypothetical protein